MQVLNERKGIAEKLFLTMILGTYKGMGKVKNGGSDLKVTKNYDFLLYQGQADPELAKVGLNGSKARPGTRRAPRLPIIFLSKCQEDGWVWLLCSFGAAAQSSRTPHMESSFIQPQPRIIYAFFIKGKNFCRASARAYLPLEYVSFFCVFCTLPLIVSGLKL